MSAGAEFSSEDVTLLFRKVFHVPSGTDEARAAMQKVTQKYFFYPQASASKQLSSGQISIGRFKEHHVLCLGFRSQEATVAGPVLVKMCWMFS